jgi:hypothetical protein
VNKIIIFLFLLSVFIISFLPVKDTDFGWHYRCGKEFLTKGKLCTKNDFSYFLPNYQSANPHLLYNILIAKIYDRFGFNGLSFLYGLMMALSGLIFIALSPSLLWIQIISFSLIFFLSYNVLGLGLRSQMVSYLFWLSCCPSSKKFTIFLYQFFLCHCERKRCNLKRDCHAPPQRGSQ